MKLSELFFWSAAEFPRKCSSNDIVKELSKLFDRYCQEIENLEGTDQYTVEVRTQVTWVREICDAILKSMGLYLDGFPAGSYTELKSIMDSGDMKSHIQMLSSKIDAATRKNLYRIRLKKAGRFDERKDIFHIPFEKRTSIASQRFSIPGFPSLYLGGSIYVCWEELGEPPFHEMHISRMEMNEKVTVLDLAIDYDSVASIFDDINMADSNAYLQEVRALITLWPLAVASHIKRTDDAGNFVPEYIIPQQLMQWTRETRTVSGIRYLSTRVKKQSHSKALLNYVFPASESKSAGHCTYLSKAFLMTEPTSWSILEMTPATVNSSEEGAVLPNPGWPYNEPERIALFGNKSSIRYESTQFSLVERELRKHSCSKLT